MAYTAVMFYGPARLRTFRSLPRGSDVAAMLLAESLLERSPSCVAVEVWEGERRIGKLYRPLETHHLRYPGAA